MTNTYPHARTNLRARSHAYVAAGASIAVTTVLSTAPSAHAVDSRLPVDLGRSAAYSVLAGSAVTNTLASTLTGNLGVSPGATISGFPPGVTNGTTRRGDTLAALAHHDADAASTDVRGRVSTMTVKGDVAGKTFRSGVYASAAALEVSAGGTVTLDAENDPETVFIFQVGSALNVGSRTRHPGPGHLHHDAARSRRTAGRQRPPQG